MDVLDLFTQQRRDLGVTEAASLLGKPKSTVSRWLAAMEESGFVDREAASGSAGVNVEMVESLRPLKHVRWPGRQVPLHATAAGKTLLAWLPREALDRQGESRAGVARVTGHSRKTVRRYWRRPGSWGGSWSPESPPVVALPLRFQRPGGARMAYREVAMWEILAALERVHRGESRAGVARVTGHSRTTVRRYLATAGELGGEPGRDPPTEALAAEVYRRHRPAKERGPGEVEAELLPHLEQLRAWLIPGPEEKRGLTLTKVQRLLERQGLRIPYSSLHRFAVRHCGVGRGGRVTVRMAPCRAPGGTTASGGNQRGG